MDKAMYLVKITPLWIALLLTSNAHAGFFDKIKDIGESVGNAAKEVTKETTESIKKASEKVTGKSNTQQEIVKTPNQDPVLVTRVQSELKRLGYQVSVDGAYGPGTRSAIIRFQQTNKLQATGDVSNELLQTARGTSSPASSPQTAQQKQPDQDNNSDKKNKSTTAKTQTKVIDKNGFLSSQTSRYHEDGSKEEVYTVPTDPNNLFGDIKFRVSLETNGQIGVIYYFPRGSGLLKKTHRNRNIRGVLNIDGQKFELKRYRNRCFPGECRFLIAYASDLFGGANASPSEKEKAFKKSSQISEALFKMTKLSFQIVDTSTSEEFAAVKYKRGQLFYRGYRVGAEPAMSAPEASTSSTQNELPFRDKVGNYRFKNSDKIKPEILKIEPAQLSQKEWDYLENRWGTPDGRINGICMAKVMPYLLSAATKYHVASPKDEARLKSRIIPSINQQMERLYKKNNIVSSYTKLTWATVSYTCQPATLMTIRDPNAVAQHDPEKHEYDMVLEGLRGICLRFGGRASGFNDMPHGELELDAAGMCYDLDAIAKKELDSCQRFYSSAKTFTKKSKQDYCQCSANEVRATYASRQYGEHPLRSTKSTNIASRARNKCF
jgi:peptidoglycan hydrolase-like protein with peptidoglycan-binding domain